MLREPGEIQGRPTKKSRLELDIVFGRTLYSGSRFLFWAIAPFLLLFMFVIGVLVSDWTTRRGFISALLIGAAALLMRPSSSPYSARCAKRRVRTTLPVSHLRSLASRVAHYAASYP